MDQELVDIGRAYRDLGSIAGVVEVEVAFFQCPYCEHRWDDEKEL